MLKKHALEIKPATRKDMDTIAQFIRSSARWYEPFLDEKDLDEHYVDDTWKEENFKKRDFYIGKTPKEEDVGTISLQFFDDVTYLGYIYLHTDHVGKGFGHKLIDHAKEVSKDKGQKEMVLIAHPEAKWAVKAYEKYGFERYMTEKEKIINWKDGLLESYYEEGFHLYRYPLTA
ncbi:MAG: GNAT family N-acetyltransferase [Peredibacter sp.]|nr:GNAT family N-acetyltransferase [Bdellovibrionota bacterium]